jgi:alpha-glucosidase
MVEFLHFSCPPFLIYKNNAITVRIAVSDTKDSVPVKIELWCFPNNEPAVVEMTRILEQEDCSVYTGETLLDQSYNLQSYAFRIYFSDSTVIWLSSRKISRNEPLAHERFTVNLHESASLWMREQMFYQIVPDRFASDRVSDEIFATQFEPTDENFISARYHGSLAGIMSKLDYICSLGFTGIYLCPVTDTSGILGYKCRDYYSIQSDLGTEEDLIRLIEEIHRRGMKIILDLPVNHVGDDHPYYDVSDVTGHGACCHEDSPYRNYFTFRNGKAVVWKDDPHFVKLDYANRDVQDMMYRGTDSVIKHFLKPPYSVDGIKLGSVQMLGGNGTAQANMFHLHEINNEAKAVNSECYVVNEHNYDAKPWLCNPIQQEDSALNVCGFYKPMLQFLSGKDYYTGEKFKYSAEDFRNFIERYHSGIPHDKLCSLFNMIGNHDTCRIASVLNGNPQLIRVAITMMYTWIGVPCIYYGDEIGLTGERKQLSYKPMDWNNKKDIFRKLIVTLARFRHENKVIIRGSLEITYASGSVLIYERCYNRNKTIVVVNSGSTVSTVDLTENVKTLKIQQTLADADNHESTQVSRKYNVKGSLMMDNIRIMSIAELDKGNKTRIGPTSALIIQS